MQNSSWCWNIRPHEPHDYEAIIEGQSITLNCDGVTAAMVSQAINAGMGWNGTV